MTDYYAVAEHHWHLLMRCNDCDHRLIEHVDFVCQECECDQSSRGLNAYADELLLAHVEHSDGDC